MQRATRADTRSVTYPAELPALTGDEVRERREDLGLGVKELARRAGVHRATVWRVEHGAGVSTRVRRLLGAALGSEPRP